MAPDKAKPKSFGQRASNCFSGRNISWHVGALWGVSRRTGSVFPPHVSRKHKPLVRRIVRHHDVANSGIPESDIHGGGDYVANRNGVRHLDVGTPKI
jgi:hypothetical protein